MGLREILHNLPEVRAPTKKKVEEESEDEE